LFEFEEEAVGVVGVAVGNEGKVVGFPSGELDDFVGDPGSLIDEVGTGGPDGFLGEEEENAG